MIPVVLDSNVYISALLFGGNFRAIVELTQMAALQAFTSPQLIAEIEEVLRRKFAWRETRIRAAANSTWRTATQPGPTQRITDCPDAADNRVLECAVAASAHYIVTGDRHLLDLNPYRRISIVTPRQFLDAVSSL